MSDETTNTKDNKMTYMTINGINIDTNISLDMVEDLLDAVMADENECSVSEDEKKKLWATKHGLTS